MTKCGELSWFVFTVSANISMWLVIFSRSEVDVPLIRHEICITRQSVLLYSSLFVSNCYQYYFAVHIILFRRWGCGDGTCYNRICTALPRKKCNCIGDVTPDILSLNANGYLPRNPAISASELTNKQLLMDLEGNAFVVLRCKLPQIVSPFSNFMNTFQIL